MRWILFLVLALPVLANDADLFQGSAKYTGRILSNEYLASIIKNRISDQHSLAVITDEAIANIIVTATKVMTIKGHSDDAQSIRTEFDERFRGFLTHMVDSPSRMIGDHKPLVEWLDVAYLKMQNALGLPLCKTFHISDIYSLNHCIPVCFHPCSFSLDGVTVSREAEFINHFAGDGVYSGLAPVIGYWVTWGVCEGSTLGAGWFLICSPLGDAVEYIVENDIAPNLGADIYSKECE